jgi:outer membrane protein assembly factor BamB
MNQQAYTFDQKGEELPFFKQYRVSLTNPQHNLLITNRYVPEEQPRMNIHLTTTHFFGQNGFSLVTLWNPQTGAQIFPKYHYLNMGHLVVLPVGHRVFGIDPVEKKLLWEKDLYGTTGGNGLPPMWQQPNGMPPITVDPRDNAVQVMYQDGWMQRIGQTTSLEGQVICLQTREALQAIDPLTGRTLWTRSDLGSRSQILSDADHFYVVELNHDNNPSATRVLRAQDGVSVKAPDFAALYAKRVRMIGRHLLLNETDDGSKKVTLRLYDVLTGKDAWKHEFAPKSITLQSEDPNFAGVVEPDGKLHVYDMRNLSGEELYPKAQLAAKHLEKVQNVVLFTDDANLYLTCNGESDPNLIGWGGIVSNLMPNMGMRSLTVNGELYSFNRADGELNWHNPVPNQMLVMDQFKELPVMLFTARYAKWMNQGVNKQAMQFVATQSIEKQSGKLKYFNESVNNGQQQQYTGLNVDLRNGKIELVSWNVKLVHRLLTEDGKVKPGTEEENIKDPPKKGPPPGTGKGLGRADDAVLPQLIDERAIPIGR